VKVSNRKGIANQTGPESCVVHREVRDEALTGEPAGQPLNRESDKLLQGADAVSVAEGDTDRRDSASAWMTLRGLRPWHVGTLLAREPGDLLLGRLELVTERSALRRRGVEADEEGAGEVRPFHSSEEAGEQTERLRGRPLGWRGGVSGAKGRDRGKHGRATHVPDTPSRESVSQGLERVREAARKRKKERFTALMHHVTIDLLKDAYSWLKREAAPGVDGRTWQ
jgi:hypothetical protein